MQNPTQQRTIKIGDDSRMLQGKAEDSYQSRYNSRITKPRTSDGQGIGGNYSDGTMSQINRMTRG